MWWLTYVVLHCHTYIIFYILKNVKQHSLTLMYHTTKLLQMKKLSYYMVAIFLLSSCVKNNNSKDVGKKLGYIPVYSTSADLFIIKSKPATAVINAGKIYVKDNYIFQVELGEGIHIINNQTPANATRFGFIQIKGCSELSIKNSFLYSNNFNDLVVIDISNINQVTEVKRIQEAFYKNGLGSLPPNRGYFECVDASKGQVIKWIKDSIVNPTCLL